MSIEIVNQIMQEVSSGFLATTDGDRASVRPMGSAVWVDRELWMACSPRSAKADDVHKKPQVELCFMDKDCRHVRIDGTCTVSMEKADQDRYLKLMPWATNYFEEPMSENMAVLRLKVGRIRLMLMDDLKYVDVEPA
jgi:uncharacterized pyridoxamine 5'-phosphate oxidase family protein